MRGHTDSEKMAEAIRGEKRNARFDSGSERHEMNGWINGLGFNTKRSCDFIVQNIVGGGICTGCAACVTICPYDVFDYVTDGVRTFPQATRDINCTDCKL